MWRGRKGSTLLPSIEGANQFLTRAAALASKASNPGKFQSSVSRLISYSAMASSPKLFLRNYAIYFFVRTVFVLFFSSQTIAQKCITGEQTPVSHYVVVWLVVSYMFALLKPLPIRLRER